MEREKLLATTEEANPHSVYRKHIHVLEGAALQPILYEKKLFIHKHTALFNEATVSFVCSATMCNVLNTIYRPDSFHVCCFTFNPKCVWTFINSVAFLFFNLC